MTIALVVNGNTWNYPEQGDVNWAAAATGWANAITYGVLQKSGGAFTLLADVNFGTTYGLIANYFTSTSTHPAAAGDIRLANADTINWRNAANTADLTLTVGSNNELTFSGTINLGAATASSLTVTGTTTLSSFTSAGVVTNNSSGVLATNTTLPATYLGTFSGDIVSAGNTYTTAFRTAPANNLIGNPTGSTATIENIAIGSTFLFNSATLETGALSGDVTSSSNSFVTTLSSIQGTAVSGATGTGNVVFSSAPTIASLLLSNAAEENIHSNGNSGSAITIAWNNGNLQSLTISANTTLTFTAPTNPGKFMLIMTENGTGNFSITLPTIKWASGTSPTWVTTANAINILSVVYDGTTYYGVGNTGFA